MPKTRIRVPLGEFIGGLNEDDAPGALQPNELRIARNVYWEGRALASRRGSSRQQATSINSAAAGAGIWQLERNQGANLDLLAVFGNKLYKDALSDPPTDITGAITITAGQNNQVTFTHFNDLAVMCNGVDAPWKWNGTGNAAVLGGSPPIFNTMLAKWNRMFGAGHAAAPRTIRFAALGDPETWAAANTVAAILGDSSSAIEGRDFVWQLGHLGDVAFVGLQHSLGRILYTGDSTTPFRYNQLAEFGMEGAHNYVAVGNGGYFLSPRGVHFIRPTDIIITYETSLISGRRLRTLWENLNLARLKRTSGTLFRTPRGNLLVLWPLTIGSGAIHDTLLIMDVTDGPGTERFAVWTGWDANAMTAGVHPTTRVERLFFTSAVGFVWEGVTGTNDNSAAYLAEGATRWEDFGSPSEKKNFRDLYLEARQTGAFNLNIDVYFDYQTTAAGTLTQSLAGAAPAVWGTFVWGTGVVRDYLLGVDDGVVMSFRFYTSGADQPWAVYKIVPAVEAVGEAKEEA